MINFTTTLGGGGLTKSTRDPKQKRQKVKTEQDEM